MDTVTVVSKCNHLQRHFYLFHHAHDKTIECHKLRLLIHVLSLNYLIGGWEPIHYLLS